MGNNKKKSFSNMVKFKLLLLLAILTAVALFTIGCSKPNDKINNETNAKNSEEVINNGGLYVGYKENVYFRQYTICM